MGLDVGSVKGYTQLRVPKWAMRRSTIAQPSAGSSMKLRVAKTKAQPLRGGLVAWGPQWILGLGFRV